MAARVYQERRTYFTLRVCKLATLVSFNDVFSEGIEKWQKYPTGPANQVNGKNLEHDICLGLLTSTRCVIWEVDEFWENGQTLRYLQKTSPPSGLALVECRGELFAASRSSV